ncbi:ENTH/VHS family protein [Forsythia ovata]|uniref:ENTH/VHS family protein n=1 Tax=Forsythia ovata TaxID=205694 RepID=A0ABD1UXK3_9LAMI
MGSSFNTQILGDKLMKLNSSQQSIETLSHWCIFHMNNAKQVVETWDRQFHCSPHEQRLAFLYLANDIIQNSRRKGAEFVTEFWKVLPDALRDVIEHGDELGKNSALRLISIWEERKVFGSRGQILKEEFVKNQINNDNKNGKHVGVKPKPTAGNTLDKIVSGYQVVYGGQLDEDAVLNNCSNAISSIEKIEKDIGSDYRPGHLNQSGIMDELKGKHAILRDCIEQLRVVESSRTKLISLLREALQEQEYKLDQVRNQLQAAHALSEQAGNIYQQAVDGKGDAVSLAEQSRKGTQTSQMSHNFMSGSREQSAPIMYTRQVPFTEKSGQIEEDPKSAAAAVAAKLTASTSSAEMLTYVLSSLASEGVISNQIKESTGDYSSEKRAKIENDHASYVPQNPQVTIPPYSHHASIQHNLPVASQESNPDNSPPPPPSSPPPLPPLPPMQPYPIPQYMPTAGPVPNVPYGYNTSQHPVRLPGYSPVGPPMNGVSPFGVLPPNAYQTYPTEGGFYGQQSSLPTPVTRQ